MVSIREIAKLTGYSPSTISRYINQSGYVSKEAAEMIQKVISEKHYYPNQSAIDLSSGHTRKIGVVVPHTKHYYFTEIIRGMIEMALSSQYQLVILPSDYDVDKELAYLDQLRSKALEAIVFTSRAISLETIESYQPYGQIVCLEKTDKPNLSSVYINRYTGYLGLFSYLKTKPIKRMALFFTRNDEISETYRETMSYCQNLLPSVSCHTFGHLSQYEDATIAFNYLNLEEPFDCVLSNSDDLAAGLLEIYSEKGLTTPLIVSQEAQLSGKLQKIPSIKNQTYRLGMKAFKAAISKDVKTQSLSSTFLEKR
ncbi:hypothetical protein HMPREF9318_01737 [Streptococcus urinalis FB127-CNA-2]|uniref:Periplasmic binding protein and sugar binding domain of the LacI family protein n=1 Tax=Streptococcus urinalis 2285-97 TaxID=764291 RepID=G5KEB1_9STRE|nr:LacI family DNA-binding transcriptional regulator [Streptococcus urinalis]EHJ57168.1 periplasmic binding protein and sugar binding domain of the LacI family protein [Streptococcus urinalis 2285-97]EKS18238.1 hypothetical protein HMPREF9318_01737 [Streptococcus urinalis FB127-CNA-2]VEF32888.1 sugar-binding transcriptional regulator, LacI family [Streptococcus urinalis]